MSNIFVLLARRLSTLFTDLSPIPSAGLSVCLSVCVSVWKVYCDKTANWICVLFGVVSGVVRVMDVLDGVQVGGDALFPNYVGRTYQYQWTLFFS